MTSEVDDDELPAISVNSSSRLWSELSMPSAQVLASQRAREEEYEKELQMLREESEACAIKEHSCDSSGSESEAALLSAVSALRLGMAPSDARSSSAAVAILVALLHHCHRQPHSTPHCDNLLQDHLTLLQQGQHHQTSIFFNNVMSRISSVLSCEENTWSEDEVREVGAWLAVCAAAGACEAGAALRARRALHALLDYVATEPQVASLATWMCDAVRDARALLELSDSARSGAGRGADTLSTSLLRAAFRALHWDLFLPQKTDTHRQNQTPCDQYLATQAAGRALAGGVGAVPGGRGALLAALEARTDSHSNHYEHLKVRVAISKLRLLFRDE